MVLYSEYHRKVKVLGTDFIISFCKQEFAYVYKLKQLPFEDGTSFLFYEANIPKGLPKEYSKLLTHNVYVYFKSHILN